MNPPSEDIKDILEGESGLGLTFMDNLHVGHMPESPPAPDNCVCVYDQPGEKPESGYIYHKPGLQVKVRGDKGAYKSAHQLCQEIRDVLHDLHGVTINGARYICIWAESDIMPLGPDERHRPSFTINFRIHRTDT